MANQVIGEIEITLGGEVVTLRPTFEGIAEIETRLGMGIAPLAGKFARGEFGIREVAALVHGGMIGAGNRKRSYEQVGELVRRAGLGSVSVTAAMFIGACLKGDEESQDQGNPPQE